ncbi:tRNA (guanine(6)-N2)-methyltransferase THUMP3 isoform X3 [Pan paniscus]|uniref:tRNA (guanine(6)-N2)-methyltransferase THUMP3 isoform X3 n=1 Tax=Pan troglodytes TaxID=9598 RepID=UPI001560C230|nr:tRNA (guanine(6)-N2)-methyltransferase THUMP3 isoform X3 [Pan troglodytes]XP_054536202.1 tRNA (guanine(6)-N2)-methyltransferase THUMP3 isoform X3 [Pan troglodytes]XP_054536203.1 tRNA (guanine(6)-N2)-methyltransferase THUMP3 isoform X3 [Pan troglodytes]XP_054966897.1 tRNA (guanine(6)-N2)-methyltransferase THUMP3 isoform X3 [Pan paniscus]
MCDIEEATNQLLDVNLHENQKSVQVTESDLGSESELLVTIGATVPTGFEQTAADEVREKLGSSCKISRDRGKIYFVISVESLAQVHCLRSVDNLFVVVQEFQDYQFKQTKEEVLKDFEDLAGKLPWSNPLKVWKINASFKKKKAKRKKINQNSSKEKINNGQEVKIDQRNVKKEFTSHALDSHILDYYENPAIKEDVSTLVGDDLASCKDETDESSKEETEPQVLKFRVTCNRAGEKHCFTSNEAARDFGGAVQDYFKWKADMTNFDVEVLLNIHDNEVIVGIALTEESLHRRNITHFGPTTLRSTLAYGMLSKPSWGLPIDAVQWDICNLPLRTGSVDIIVTDLPFGKRMGSKKRNWNLYPACLREMSRVCTPTTGRAVLLTQDTKCFTKALSGMRHVWRKVDTVWVNVGGLRAAVYVLIRTPQAFVHPSEQDGERGTLWQCKE